MLAKLASKSAKPDGMRWILPEEEEVLLPGLRVNHLPGVGLKTERLLARLNIRTIGDLRLLSRDSLRNLLGLPGLVLYDRCRGEDTPPVSLREIPRSIRRETTFHEETTEREYIGGALYYLTERATNTLRRLGLEARQVGVKIRYSDFAEESATRRLPAATQLDSEVFLSAVTSLEKLFTRRVALRLVGVCLSDLVPDSGLRQLELFHARSSGDKPGAASGDLITRQRREQRLLECLDTIRKRYGYSSVDCGRTLTLLETLSQDDHGFILRTPSLTQ
jgi:DNA polymerase-4